VEGNDKNIQPTAQKSPTVQIRKKWQWGLTAGAGASWRRGNTSDGNEAVPNSLSGGGVILVGGVSSKPKQPQRLGGAYSAGLFAEKELSQKWRLHIGLGYTYFSTRQSVGTNYNPTVAADSVWLFVLNGGTRRADFVYVNGNNARYTNRTHTFNIPLELQYRLGKSPWRLHAGAMAMYLLGSNTLVYKAGNNTYIQSNGLYNRLALFANTGLSVRPKKENGMALGLRLHYQLSSFTKTAIETQKMLSAQVFCQIPFSKK
jgi:hypothetical protein